MSFSALGTNFNCVCSFKEYLKTVSPPKWIKGITFHHTGSPNLKNRPDGLTDQHLINIKNYYQNDLKWSSSPHLFIDDFRIMMMCPLHEYGIHAPSFNKTHIGIEILGNYDFENPNEGRGKECWNLAIEAGKALLEWLNLSPSEDTVKFHRECKITQKRSGKSCPGKLIDKADIINRLKS